MSLPEGTKIQLWARWYGEEREIMQSFWNRQNKWLCACDRDGNLYELSEEIRLDKNIKHNIEIVVDRLVVKPGLRKDLRIPLRSAGSGRWPYAGGYYGWKDPQFQPELFLP